MSFNSGYEEKSVYFERWFLQDPVKHSLFPEQVVGHVPDKDNCVGMTVSGGGARSHGLLCGYLRGLHALGLEKEIHYLSAVSGGSWAASIYVFFNSKDCNFSEEKLLGPSIQPEDCTVAFLRRTTSGRLAEAIIGWQGVSEAVKSYLVGVPADKLWQRMIGSCLLKPFNLHDKLMALTEGQKQRILERNPWIKGNHIVIPKANRPFLIISASLSGPKGFSSGTGDSLQFTPMYAGVPFYKYASKRSFTKSTIFHYLRYNLENFITAMSKYRTQQAWLTLRQVAEEVEEDYAEELNPDYELVTGKVGEDTEKPILQKEALEIVIGGGVFETFAFGSEKLMFPEDYFPLKRRKEVVEGIMTTKDLFFLEDVVGASSAAFVIGYKNRGLGKELEPCSAYIPFLNDDHPELSKIPSQRHLLGLADGGNYENTGLLPLLQRGVRKALCFINDFHPIDLDFEDNIFIYDGVDNILNTSRRFTPKGKKLEEHHGNEYLCAGAQLLSLFGVIKEPKLEYNYTENKVFETSKLNEVMHRLIKNILAGNGAVSRHRLPVIQNKAWNIIGGYELDVVFVYNEHCRSFEDKLPESTKREFSKADSTFKNFPFYNTTFQTRDMFSLDDEAVTLLAAQGDFIIKRNAELLADFLRPTSLHDSVNQP